MRNNDANDNKSQYSGTEQTQERMNRRTGNHERSGVQRLQDHRDDIQDLADSDLPCAWVADALLDVADDVDGDSDRDGSGGGGGDR